MTEAQSQPRSRLLRIAVASEALALIDEAARSLGKTRTRFVRDAVREASEEVLLGQRQFVLDADCWDAFAAALDAPPEPNERLAALLSRRPAWER